MPSPDIKSRFEELKRRVLAKRPILETILKKQGQKTLLEYANEYVDVNLIPTIPRRQTEFLSVVKETVEKRLGKTVADSVIRQLEKYYFVSTADHTGPLTHPFPVNSNLLTAAAIATHSDPDLENVIVLSCANVSVDNSDFTRGIFFHNYENDQLQTHRLGFYTSNYRPPSVYTLPAYTEKEVKDIYHKLDVKRDKSEIDAAIHEKITSLVKDVYDQPDAYNSANYAEQMTKTNFKLWKKILGTSKVKLPNFISLGMEDIVVSLLIKYHLYEDTVLNHMLFDPRYEPFIDKYFEGIHGSFSRENSSGTYLFWAIPKGSRYNVQLWRKGNYLVSKDESYKIELKPEIIQKALESRELIPSLLLDFATISFYYGVKCLGGFDQVNYLTQMKDNYIKMNVDLKNYRSIEICARAQTREICVGLSFAFMEYGNHEVALASGPDLFLYGKENFWPRLMETITNLTLEDAIGPLMPEMYKISFDQQEWDPEVVSVTENDINEILGLHDKINPCIEIKPCALRYHVLWPGGNTTALVEEKFPRREHVSIARKILAATKELEQVGFLEAPENPEAALRLQMMGGEFCGNAARTAAYFWAMKTSLKSFNIEVSGFPELLHAEVDGDDVELQLPGSFFKKVDEDIVDLMGIRFIIQKFPKDLNKARSLIEKYKGDFPAVGVIYTNFTDEKITIDPIVWVRETNTCYDETACGSGSIAAGIAASLKNPGKNIFTITQPSNESYTVALEYKDGQISNIKFRGVVKYKGEQITLLDHEKDSISTSS